MGREKRKDEESADCFVETKHAKPSLIKAKIKEIHHRKMKIMKMKKVPIANGGK